MLELSEHSGFRGWALRSLYFSEGSSSFQEKTLI